MSNAVDNYLFHTRAFLRYLEGFIPRVIVEIICDYQDHVILFVDVCCPPSLVHPFAELAPHIPICWTSIQVGDAQLYSGERLMCVMKDLDLNSPYVKAKEYYKELAAFAEDRKAMPIVDITEPLTATTIRRLLHLKVMFPNVLHFFAHERAPYGCTKFCKLVMSTIVKAKDQPGHTTNNLHGGTE